MTATATWQGSVIARSDRTQEVDGFVYFPPDTVDRRYLQASQKRTECHWKGTASYFHVVVDGKVNQDAAWVYADPKPEAAHFSGWIAFWKGVEITR